MWILKTGEKYVPYCIEPSLGCGPCGAGLPRTDAYDGGSADGQQGKGRRSGPCCDFHPALAPFQGGGAAAGEEAGA